MLDVLQHDDGVVDDDADGQHQPEQRQVVEREPHQTHDGEGADQGDADIDHRENDRFPVLQEQQDNNANQDDRLEQGVEDLVHGLTDERRGVVDDGVLEPLGEALLELAHPRLDAVGDVQGVRPGELKDRQAHRRLAVQGQALVLVLGAQLGAADVLEIGDLAVGAGREDDVRELLRLDQPAEGGERVLEVLAAGYGGPAELPGRHLHVLLQQDPSHIAGGQVPRRQLGRVEPDAHAVILPAEGEDVPHALDAPQRVLEIDGRIVAQVELVVLRPARRRVVLGNQVDDEEDVRGPLLDGHADGLDLGGHRRQGDGDSVLHQDLGHVDVGPQREGHVQGVRAVVAALRRHVEHVLDAVDLLLDGGRYRVGEHLGVGPGVGSLHADGRGRDIRVLGDRQQARGDPAQEDDNDGDDPRQDGTIDEETRQHNNTPQGDEAEVRCPLSVRSNEPATRRARATRTDTDSAGSRLG